MFLPETATLAFRELMSTSVPDKVNHFKNTLDELFPFTGITEISRSSSGYFREKKTPQMVSVLRNSLFQKIYFKI